MKNEDKKHQSDRSETANIRQTNKQQKDEQGEINLGGREFTGNQMDNETTRRGLPTIDPLEETNKKGKPKDS